MLGYTQERQRQLLSWAGLPEGDWQSYGQGQFFIVPKGVKFEVEAAADVAYLCYYKR